MTAVGREWLRQAQRQQEFYERMMAEEQASNIAEIEGALHEYDYDNPNQDHELNPGY